jgi:site-specific DNA recombinase
VYTSLGLRLNYDPYLRRVKATADLSRFAGCFRGCLRPKGET